MGKQYRQRTATNDPVIIDTVRRRTYVLNLRRRGASYATIATKVESWAAEHNIKLPNGWDCRYAYKDVKREIGKLQAQLTEDAEHVRSMELERLNALLEGVWDVALPQDDEYVDVDLRLKATDRALKIMEQRRRLVPNLDQPIPIEQDVEVLVIGGVDLDEL